MNVVVSSTLWVCCWKPQEQKAVSDSITLFVVCVLAGRVLKRNKGSRVAKIDRQRAPYPLPRPGKIKTVHPRPSPVSRKRRYSGRSVRALQPANASEETDMAQADEMGEGEGKDDGFIDGGGQEPFRRRSKKRTGDSSSQSMIREGH